jgi:hypothetical protein
MCNSEIKKLLISRLGGHEMAHHYGDLDSFIALAMARLNRTGYTTHWSVGDPIVTKYFSDVIVSWSLIMAWQSKASSLATINYGNPDYANEKNPSALLELCRVEGDSFRLAHDKIADTKRDLKN